MKWKHAFGRFQLRHKDTSTHTHIGGDLASDYGDDDTGGDGCAYMQ